MINNLITNTITWSKIKRKKSAKRLEFIAKSQMRIMCPYQVSVHQIRKLHQPNLYRDGKMLKRRSRRRKPKWVHLHIMKKQKTI